MIMAHIDSASVACGVYAGSASITIATAVRCHQLGVEVGAHPGYDDPEGFGRREREVSPEQIEALVTFQVAALAAVVPVAYVKPHGALYHRCQSDPASADAVARVAKAHGVGLVGQPGLELLAAARRACARVSGGLCGSPPPFRRQPGPSDTAGSSARRAHRRRSSRAPCALGAIRHRLHTR